MTVSVRRLTTTPLLGLTALAAVVLSECRLAGPSLSKIVVQQSSVVIASYDFGSGIIANSNSPITFTVVNDGSTTVNLGGASAVRITGTNSSDFVLTSPPGSTIGGGQSTAFSLAFSPTAIGARNATVTITPASGGQNCSFAISGTGYNFGVQQSGTAAASYDFGFSTIGVASSDVIFTVVNETSGSISFGGSAVTFSGANASDFTMGTPPPSTLSAGASAPFILKFTPDSYGPRTAAVTVSATGGTPSYSFAVSGTGTSGSFTLTSGGAVTYGETINLGTLQFVSNTTLNCSINNTSSTNDLYLLLPYPWVSVTGAGTAITLGLKPLSNTISTSSSVPITISAGYSHLAHGTYTATVTIQTSDPNNQTFTFYVTMDYEGP